LSSQSRAYLLRVLSVPTAEPVSLIGALHAHAEFLPFRDLLLELEENVPTSAAVVAELRRLKRDDYLHSVGSGTMGRIRVRPERESVGLGTLDPASSSRPSHRPSPSLLSLDDRLAFVDLDHPDEDDTGTPELAVSVPADVYQCRHLAADGSVSGDTCPRDGGLDQNIYRDFTP